MGNDLTFGKLKIRGAKLGKENCLPDIKNDDYIHASIAVTNRVSQEERANIGKGMIPTLLPYQIQSEYDRSRQDLEFNAATLENDYLKATFVPELGGRLWSLYDKKADKELLFANDVFQPGNLALRNAWFSGGVEWNMGIKGHNPLTCSQLFTEELHDEHGDPMLRMYEFERIREAVYSITAKLDKDILLIRIVLENTSDEDKYMYWWSNIAVDETPRTRVVVPAEESYFCSYREGSYLLDVTGLPYMDGKDVTYSSNLQCSRDFFYKIPKEEKKWIAAVGEDGYGLVQISTDQLSGRKAFVWGQQEGGRHWNRWLTDSGKNYIELQAGVLKTQLEHFVMKKHSQLSWTEGYSALQTEPSIVHGECYQDAIWEVKGRIAGKQSVVEESDFAANTAGTLHYMGSGWGALQEISENTRLSEFLDFPGESIGAEKEWLDLILTGDIAVPDEKACIKSYVKGRPWIDRLLGASESWYQYYHLGVLYYEEGQVEEAWDAFQRSVGLLPNAWAYRNLSQLAKNEYHNPDEAADYMVKAIRERDDYPPLWVNFAEAMIAAGRYDDWVARYESLPKNLKEVGRLKLLYALGLSRTGRAEEALQAITEHFEMPDIKEGEFSVSHIWLEIHREIMKRDGLCPDDAEIYARYPLPYELDFRMH